MFKKVDIMGKTSKNSPLDTIQIADSWDNTPLVEWITSNKQYLIWGVAILFAAMILTYRFLSWNNGSTEEDYYRAQNIFSKFQGDVGDNQDELNELEAIMRRHPELQAKYDGAMAQTLLIEGNVAQAKAFANMTFNRTRPDHLSSFEDYSKTSLLIGEGNYNEALQQAKLLQEKLESEQLTDTHLYAFNAIRIAYLYKELGLKDEELAAWSAVQKLRENYKSAAEAFALYNSGSTSLNAYVEGGR